MDSNPRPDSQQEQFRKKIAKWLNISYAELEEYAEDVEPNNGIKGKEKFGYYIQFSDATPAEITDKIKRLDSNYCLFFNLEELDARY
jgi:hypothetical protein